MQQTVPELSVPAFNFATKSSYLSDQEAFSTQSVLGSKPVCLISRLSKRHEAEAFSPTPAILSHTSLNSTPAQSSYRHTLKSVLGLRKRRSGSFGSSVGDEDFWRQGALKTILGVLDIDTILDWRIPS